MQRRYLSAESMALVLTEPTDPTVEAEEVTRLAGLTPDRTGARAGPHYGSPYGLTATRTRAAASPRR